MTDLEDEMRRALFGSVVPRLVPAQEPVRPVSSAEGKAKRTSPKLRVTLHVTREYEGKTEVLIHDASTLSTIEAEIEAKAKAKKLRYRYIDVVSVSPVD